MATGKVIDGTEAHVQRTGHDVDVVDVRCPYADAEECMTARERSAAGRSDHIPECPAHGPYPDTNPSSIDDPGYDRVCEACGLAYSAHPDEARHSCDGAE